LLPCQHCKVLLVAAGNTAARLRLNSTWIRDLAHGISEALELKTWVMMIMIQFSTPATQ